MAFTATLGLVNPAAVTTTGGLAVSSFVGELIAGVSTITAMAESGAWGQAQVRIRPAAAASLTLAVSPQEIGVGGQVAQLTATVKDPYGNPAADGTAVQFSTDLGELSKIPARGRPGPIAGGRGQGAGGQWPMADGRWPIAGGEVWSTVTLTVTTTRGMAAAELVSGPAAGMAHVQVAVAPGLRQTADVPIRPAAAATVTLIANPQRVFVGGRTQLTATVTDCYGNAVAEGTMVRFRANRGRLDQTDVPTVAGIASTWLTADRQPGAISIVAISGYASSDFATVEVDLLRSYMPLVGTRRQESGDRRQKADP
jgi:hypothetical protein